jgi:P pilus assembly chaperone PapD
VKLQEVVMLLRVWKLSLLLLIISLTFFPSQTLAVGLGVTPGKLAFTVRPGGTEVQTLHVINQSNRESEFRVYVEGKYEKWFLISPGEFTLAPQQSKGVEVVVAPPFTASDEHDFSICVVSLPAGSDLRIGAGIKVPAHVQILEYPVALILGGGIATLALVVSASILIRRRRKAHNA